MAIKVMHLNFLSFLIANKLWLSAGFLLAFSSSFGQTFFISIFAAEIMYSLIFQILSGVRFMRQELFCPLRQ